MKINPRDWEKYEKPLQSYSIEFARIEDYNELLKQFNRVRRTATYQHNNNYKETAIAMCISHNNGDMSKQVSIRTGKRGRPKKEFVRDDNNPLYHSSIPHETHPHIHFLAVGKGSRSLVEIVCKNENKRAKQCVAKLYSNKGFAPIGYLRQQASIYREIGNIDAYIDDDWFICTIFH